MDIFPRNRHEATQRATEILRQHSGPNILTRLEATRRAADESVFFVRKTSLFADGSGPGVDIYRYEPELGHHTLIGCVLDKTARQLHGCSPILKAIPADVNTKDEEL